MGADRSTPVGGTEPFEMPLWRALAVFRMAALGYSIALVARNFERYSHPVPGWLIIGVMGGWTAATIYGYGRPRWRGWPLLLADLAVTAGCLLISPWVLGTSGRAAGKLTIPLVWVAGPVIAWAISGGRRRGAIAAILMGAGDLSVRQSIDETSLDSTVLMLLAGIAVGHVARLAVDAQERLQRATHLDAATRERERLARGIHDSVLQVLALFQRRGAELGGEAAELGRLAGEQEAALRALVSAGAGDDEPGGETDLRAALGRFASPTISLAAPAGAVPIPTDVADEVAAAVAAALDNVRRHCGPQARAWVLVEDEGDAVTVTVRDDGPGIAPGRLERAAHDGRLGVAQSIRGRVRDLGGAVTITSAPGQGTEVELRLPRR